MNEAPTELTQEAKRIKIAIHRGWKWFPSPYNSEQRVLARSEQEAETVLVGHMAYHLAPDCFNDLNACREMEKALETTAEWDAYIEALNAVTKSPMWSHRHVIGAEAFEKAEAFGKAKNLW